MIRPLCRPRRSPSSRLAVAIAVVGALAVSSFAPVARAQVGQVTAAPGAKEDLTTLEKSLAEEHDALSTTDCANACRALASIRRAADKICALAPRDRCAAGRAKAEDATRRVREACPECAIASAAPEPKPEPATAGVETVQAAPPSESKRGGCAGCTSTSAAPGDLAGGVMAALALAFVLRRRRVGSAGDPR